MCKIGRGELILIQRKERKGPFARDGSELDLGSNTMYKPT